MPHYSSLFSCCNSVEDYISNYTNPEPNPIPKTESEERQYLQLVRDILDHGDREVGRNGTTLVKFGNMMRFSLKDGTLPLLTTKRVAYKTCLEELLWFVRGETDARILQAKNVHIWDGNANRAFLDGRGLHEYPEGVLGPVYGFQWRHFGADYDCIRACPRTGSIQKGSEAPLRLNEAELDEYDPTVAGQMDPESAKHVFQGVDQLQQIIDTLKDPQQRASRRIILSAWNPMDLDKMALPPCHILAQFHVSCGTKLSCALYQRSCDVGLGVPFNIASYSLLTHLLAKYCGLEAHEFVYFMGNTHIYESHIDGLKEQVEQPMLAFPKIRVSDTIQERPFDQINVEDVQFTEPYRYGKEIKLPFVA